MEKKKLALIDGSSLLYRAFYALPLLTNKEGVYTNGVYGFLTMLNRIEEDYQPDYLAVAFDKSGPTFRHEEYDQYKANRQETPSELAQQFPLVREILQARGIKVLEMNEYEADDIAGSLAKMGQERDLETLMVTGDKDYLQLATDEAKVLLTRKGISQIEVYDRDRIIEEYGIEPQQFIDLKGLMGDPSDNIPGVPGIGEKTGLKLLKEYGSMEEVYENLDKLPGVKLKENLVENEKIAYLSRRLGEILVDIPLDVEIEDLARQEPDWPAVAEFYQTYGFKSLLDKLPGEYRQEEEIIDYKIENIRGSQIGDLIKEIKKEKKFAFKILNKDENYIKGKVLGLGIKLGKNKSYYIDLEEDPAPILNQLKEVFEDDSIEKIGYLLKADIVNLLNYGIGLENYTFDLVIGQYILDPSQNDYSINKISQDHLDYYGQDEEELLGKGKKKKNYQDLDLEARMDRMAFILATIFRTEEKIKAAIEEDQMDQLYYEIELPLVEVLASMEFKGFKIDKGQLEKLGQEYEKEIDQLTEEIHQMAGEDFNIKSPKQLGEILFDKLELPVIKRTKTGYSTNAEVLDKLQGQHPIIDKVLRYRQIVKLKSTYIDSYIELIDPEDGRIHSSFNQTVTSTGRISSTEPNLQNIPVKTEDGRQVRKAFVAEKPDYILVDADYSQIELRVLAHISQDEKMLEAFQKGQDIHSKTASQVFHVPLEDVTPQLRNQAKAVNFGIVYGISDYGLSRDLDISRKEAKEYIDNYLANYKKVKEFMDQTVKDGKNQGYVETLLHRRRYIPELQAKNFNIRAFGERVAMNTPIQGSAADIIKIAMVRVYQELKKRKLRSKLLLQIHDELIIETHVDEKDQVIELLREIMENAISLSVPLKADIGSGDSWYDSN